MKTIEIILERWTNAEEIRLRAGEIDPETMRYILAVTNAMAREIREEMNKREKREAEAKAKAEAPVPTEILEYWAKYEVGGSGMGTSTQQMIKNMAIELLEARNK